MTPTKTKKKKTEITSVPAASQPAPTETKSAAPRIRLDESNAKLSYANFFNVSSTREETALTFGMIQASANPRQEIPIEVSGRVVVSPHAAKRLQTMLGQVLDQYETRFGRLLEQTQSR